MAEVGIDISTEFPKPWTDEVVRAADVVITMGCGDACPVFPGKRYEEWVLEDPAGLDLDADPAHPRRDRTPRPRPAQRHRRHPAALHRPLSTGGDLPRSAGPRPQLLLPQPHDTPQLPTQEGPPVHLVAIGGSDAGISAALRARELDPSTDVTVVVADAYPNFSICGIPYYVSGEVGHWRNLAHRTNADLEATGMAPAPGHHRHRHRRRGPPARAARRRGPGGHAGLRRADRRHRRGLRPTADRRPRGADALGPANGVHLLHSMGDTFAVMQTLEHHQPASAVIVGAGYVGLEMAEGLRARGLRVTQVEALPEVLPTVDPALGALVHAELETPWRRGPHLHHRRQRQPRT